MTASLLAQLRACRVFDLEQPRYFGAPTFPAHQPGLLYTLHRRHERGLGERRTSASGMIVAAEHSGTHIDALCHQAEDLVMHGGVAVSADVQTSTGFRALGVETIAPLIARAVLLDVASAAGGAPLPPGHLIGPAELDAAAARAGVDAQPGDVLLVRTGAGALFAADPDAYAAAAGVGREGAEWLARRRPLAVGIDNLAVDVPGHRDAELGSLPAHVVLLVRAGVLLIENLYLEELASAGAREAVLVCLPLKLRGATGSPVRPVALVERG